MNLQPSGKILIDEFLDTKTEMQLMQHLMIMQVQ